MEALNIKPQLSLTVLVPFSAWFFYTGIDFRGWSPDKLSFYHITAPIFKGRFISHETELSYYNVKVSHIHSNTKGDGYGGNTGFSVTLKATSAC